MRLAYLAYRNLVSKPLELSFNLLLLVLSISLVTFILHLSTQINEQFERNIAPVDMVVGAKGSPLQLVLSSVLHIDTPTGNIALNDAERISKHPFVSLAIPVSYGDNYKGYRILGTEHTYFDAYKAQLTQGRLYEAPFEVVVGNSVAEHLGLEIGDVFSSAHGFDAKAAETHDDHLFKVVGRLAPTASVVDKLIITPTESIWQVHAHEDENHQEYHEEDHEEDALEYTSLLIKFKNPLGLMQLPRFVNENTSMQAALPRFEIQRLSGFMGSGVTTINSVAFAILVVSGLSILISLAKAIRERRKGLALLRTYGFGTKKLLYITLLEGLTMALSGHLIGWIFGQGALYFTSQYIEANFGYSLKINGPMLMDFQLLGATLTIAFVAICIASTSIFNLNISKILADD